MIEFEPSTIWLLLARRYRRVCAVFNEKYNSILIFKRVTLDWALQYEGFWEHLVGVPVRVDIWLWFCVFAWKKVTKYSCWICTIASSSYRELISSLFLCFVMHTLYFGSFFSLGHICPYSIWRWTIFAPTLLHMLEQGLKHVGRMWPAMLIGNFQTINIYVAKCFEKRCRKIIESNLNDTQYGFRHGHSNPNHISLSSKFWEIFGVCWRHLHMLCRPRESIQPGFLWKALASVGCVRCWWPPVIAWPSSHCIPAQKFVSVSGELNHDRHRWCCIPRVCAVTAPFHNLRQWFSTFSLKGDKSRLTARFVL